MAGPRRAWRAGRVVETGHGVWLSQEVWDWLACCGLRWRRCWTRRSLKHGDMGQRTRVVLAVEVRCVLGRMQLALEERPQLPQYQLEHRPDQGREEAPRPPLCPCNWRAWRCLPAWPWRGWTCLLEGAALERSAGLWPATRLQGSLGPGAARLQISNHRPQAYRV